MLSLLCVWWPAQFWLKALAAAGTQTLVNRQIAVAGRNAACAADPKQQGWGGCSPTLCTDRVDPQRRAAFLTQRRRWPLFSGNQINPGEAGMREAAAGVRGGAGNVWQAYKKGFTLPLVAREEGCSGATAAKWRGLGAGELMG